MDRTLHVRFTASTGLQRPEISTAASGHKRTGFLLSKKGVGGMFYAQVVDLGVEYGNVERGPGNPAAAAVSRAAILTPGDSSWSTELP